MEKWVVFISTLFKLHYPNLIIRFLIFNHYKVTTTRLLTKVAEASKIYRHLFILKNTKRRAAIVRNKKINIIKDDTMW